MADPLNPFVCSGKVYDLDGSTVLANALVSIYNQTNEEWLSATHRSTTNSSGEYTIDLANFTTYPASGDVLFLYAFIENKQAVVRAELNATDISNKTWETDMYVKANNLQVGTDYAYGKMASLIASCSGAKSLSVVEVKTGITLAGLNISANGTTSWVVGKPDLMFKNGYWLILATQGTYANAQTAGTTNAIGDTADNSGNVITANYR